MLLCYIKQEKTIKRYNKSGKKYPFFHKITTISVNIFMKYFLVFFFLCLTSPSYILGIMIVKKEEFERVFFFYIYQYINLNFFVTTFVARKQFFPSFFVEDKKGGVDRSTTVIAKEPEGKFVKCKVNRQTKHQKKNSRNKKITNYNANKIKPKVLTTFFCFPVKRKQQKQLQTKHFRNRNILGFLFSFLFSFIYL